MRKSASDRPFTELESVDSTNNYAIRAIHDGTACGGETYFAHHQFAGRGQRGRNWIAGTGENVAMSLVWVPAGVPPDRQFLLAAAVANVCLAFLETEHREGWSVKWPNDLYHGDRKAAGMLIENVVLGMQWRFAVIGIGLNLNMNSFPPELSRAVSLAQVTGKSYNPPAVARALSAAILDNLAVAFGQPDDVWRRYNERLYGRQELVRFRRGSETFEARVLGVRPDGGLATDRGIFKHGEVDWLLDRG